MKTFTDSSGRAWRIHLTSGTFDKVLADADFDLDAIHDAPDATARLLVANPHLFGQLFWALCETQAEECGVEPREFGRLLDSGTLDRATSALIEELSLFRAGRAAGPLEDRFGDLARKLEPQIQTEADRILADLKVPPVEEK